MCGLIGFSGKESANSYKVMHLFADNDSRGGHSVGIYMNNKLFKSSDMKSSGNSYDLLPIFAKQNIKDFGKIIIGHTRYATHGVHSIENAHPFQYRNIIGAHNGVISNYEEVGKKFNIKKTTVDSQMIFKLLAEDPSKHQRLGMFSGKANVLFTKGDGKLYVFKHGNPLYALRTKEGIYFSSLEDGLKNIKEEGDKIFSLKEDTLYVYEDGVNILKEEIKRSEVSMPVARFVNTDWRSYGNMTQKVQSYNQTFDFEEDEFNVDFDEYDYMLQEIDDSIDFVNNLYQKSYTVNREEFHLTEDEQDKMWELGEKLQHYKNFLIEVC